jgi:HlyD family secretion protein
MFTGQVSQIRLQSAMTENVVSYTVVIDLENPDEALLPGMTATVELVVDKAIDVLRVPNAALRFQPTEKMRAEARGGDSAREGAPGRQDRANRTEGRDGAGRTATQSPASSSDGAGGDAQRPGAAGEGGEESGRRWTGRNGDGAGARRGALWTVRDGRVEMIPVRTGITDGQTTVVEGDGVAEGMQAIAAVTTGGGGGSSNPFGGQQQQGGRFRGGF